MTIASDGGWHRPVIPRLGIVVYKLPNKSKSRANVVGSLQIYQIPAAENARVVLQSNQVTDVYWITPFG